MQVDPVVYQLQRAVSQDPIAVKDAEGHLNNWKKEPGFFGKLYSIFLDKQNDMSLRWIAIIQLRNSIDIIWRKNTKMSLLPEERDFIRCNALLGSIKSENLLSIQNALVVSRIARLDYPTEWPSLFHDLLGKLQQSLGTGDYDLALRLLITLHHIIKAMAGNRLLRSRQIFYKLAPELLTILQPILHSSLSSWMMILESSKEIKDSTLLSYMQISRYTLKACRRLVVFGFQNPSESEFSERMLAFCAVHQRKLLSMLGTMLQSSRSPIVVGECLEMAFAHAFLFNKLFFDFSFYSPCLTKFPATIDYISLHYDFLGQISSHLSSYKEKFEESSKNFEKLVIMSLRVFILVIQEFCNTKSSHPETAQVLYNSFLVDNRINNLLDLLITKLLILKEEDFEEWTDSPQQWVLEQSTQDVEFNVRPCAEKLLKCFFDAYGDIIVSPFKDMIYSVFECPKTLAQAVQQDTLISSFGVGYTQLKSIFPFAKWLQEAAVPNMASINDIGISRVYRRRIAIFLSQWIEDSSSEQLLEVIYKLYCSFLNLTDPCNDAVVILTTIDAFKTVLDDWNFSESSFLSIKENLFVHVLSLFKAFESVDARTSILSLLGTLLARAGEHVAPMESTIASLLSQLWDGWKKEPLLRARVLAVMHQFVNAIKAKSFEFSTFLYTVIEYCVNPESPEHVIFEADAMELWSTFLMYIQKLPETFTLLIPHLLYHLSQATSTLPFVLMIVSSYQLLDNTVLMKDYSFTIFEKLNDLLDDVKNETLQALCKTVCLLIETTPMDMIYESLLNSSLLSRLLLSIATNDKHPQVLIEYLLVVSRISLREPELILKVCQTKNINIAMLIGNWILLNDHINHSKDRKLNTLALSSLLRTNHPDVLAVLDSIMNLWFSVLSEVEEDANGDATIYYKNDDYSAVGFYLDETSEEMTRRKQLLLKDPVHSVNSRSFFISVFMFCRDANGGMENFQNQYLSTVNPALLEQFQSML
ncbi:Importin N-terminal domain-containing protein [Schizosaccharomyces pombe]